MSEQNDANVNDEGFISAEPEDYVPRFSEQLRQLFASDNIITSLFGAMGFGGGKVKNVKHKANLHVRDEAQQVYTGPLIRMGMHARSSIKADTDTSADYFERFATMPEFNQDPSQEE